jgi:hypothetical protein
MKPRRLMRHLIAVMTAATVIAALAAPVAAAPIELGTFHDAFSDVATDFCDEAGLDVRFDVVVDGRFMAMPRGRDRLIYFAQHVVVSQTITNLANSRQVSSREITVSKDLHVTDNGDGTLTIIALFTGNFTVYGSNGRAIARNPGQIRIEFIVDHAGTPDFPPDDILLSETLIKESTGRNDDFCAAVVGALT